MTLSLKPEVPLLGEVHLKQLIPWMTSKLCPDVQFSPNESEMFSMSIVFTVAEFDKIGGINAK